jgi:hypothetical protein
MRRITWKSVSWFKIYEEEEVSYADVSKNEVSKLYECRAYGRARAQRC